MVQLLHPYMTTGKKIVFTIWTFVGKLMSLLFNTLSRFVIDFPLKGKRHVSPSLQIYPSHLPLSPFSSVQFSHSVVADSLWPHESQNTRPPCPSPTPGVHSDSCPSSQWCHPAISSSVVPFFSFPQSLPASVFSNESTFRMRWPKYWSFSFSIFPSNEIPGLISFRMDLLDLLAVQGTLLAL